MEVYLWTALAVAIFSALATNQFKKQTTEHPSITARNYNHNLTAYFIFVFICALILVCVAGLRHNVGADYGGYYWRYPQWSEQFEERLKKWDEPGLSLIARFLHNFSSDGAVFIFTQSAIIISLYTFTYAKNTDNFFFCILLYIFCGCWAGSFNAVRQYLAGAVLFCGHRLMYERKFFKFCLMVFAASAFHITALVMLPMYFIVSKNLSFKKILFIIVFGIVIVYSYDILFDLIGVIKDEDTGGELSAYATNSINPLRIAIAFCPVLMYFVLKILKTDFGSEENFYISLIIINAALIFGTKDSAYLNRITIYFSPFIPLAINHLTKKFNKEYRTLLLILIITLYAILWYNTSVRGETWAWIFERTEPFYNKYGGGMPQ